jgi:hypothetical protein
MARSRIRDSGLPKLLAVVERENLLDVLLRIRGEGVALPCKLSKQLHLQVHHLLICCLLILLCFRILLYDVIYSDQSVPEIYVALSILEVHFMIN